MPSPSQARGSSPLAVIVMGVSGSGKSTLGRRLADALRAPFLEGDDHHDVAAVAKMREGRPLTDEDRRPWLDRLGTALGEAVAREGIAVAACSALKRAYRDRLARAVAAPCGFVLLDGDPPELLRRLRGRSGHYMPSSLLQSQLETLERPGEDERAVVINTSQPAEAACRTALDWLEAQAAAGRLR